MCAEVLNEVHTGHEAGPYGQTSVETLEDLSGRERAEQAQAYLAAIVTSSDDAILEQNAGEASSPVVECGCAKRMFG